LIVQVVEIVMVVDIIGEVVSADGGHIGTGNAKAWHWWVSWRQMHPAAEVKAPIRSAEGRSGQWARGCREWVGCETHSATTVVM
jgi:hypothetical protein